MHCVLVLAAACKPPPAPPAEVQLSSDLPSATVEQALRSTLAHGGPRGERIAGLSLGAAALTRHDSPNADSDGGIAIGGAGGDVRWDLEPYGAIAAAARGELLPAPDEAAEVPELWRDPAGGWVAIAGRAQVLLVGVAALGENSIPNRFTSLTEPWLLGKVAMVEPVRGAALAHFAALYAAWGEARMRAWLEGLQHNRIQLFASDDEVRAAVVQGRATVGLLSSDSAAKAAASAAKVEVVYPNQRSIGTFVWPTALSIPRNAAHPEAAQKLAAQLADRSIEQLLVAREPGFLPLRPNIATPPGVRSAANLVVISVSPARILEEINKREPELVAWVAATKGVSASPP